MKSPSGYARGFVAREGQVRSDGDGNRFIELTIEMEDYTPHRGRQFRQRIGVRSYRPSDIAEIHRLQRGTRVSVDATSIDAASWTDRATGQVFSIARLTGTLTILPAP